MIEIHPYVWYATRKLDKVPTHFTKSNTTVTVESEFWIKTRLTGRYATMVAHDNTFTLDIGSSYAYFEDPAEAMMYELRWSGSK